LSRIAVSFSAYAAGDMDPRLRATGCAHRDRRLSILNRQVAKNAKKLISLGVLGDLAVNIHTVPQYHCHHSRHHVDGRVKPVRRLSETRSRTIEDRE
jgi:hypothetical protein